MFQWLTHRHVRYHCSGHSAQVFPLKRRKESPLAGTAVHTVSLCCRGDAATWRARQVLTQHASILLVFGATRLSDPGGRSSGKWALLLVCDPSARLCRRFPEPFQTPFSFLSSRSASSIYFAVTMPRIRPENPPSAFVLKSTHGSLQNQTFGHLLLFHSLVRIL